MGIDVVVGWDREARKFATTHVTQIALTSGFKRGFGRITAPVTGEGCAASHRLFCVKSLCNGGDGKTQWFYSPNDAHNILRTDISFSAWTTWERKQREIENHPIAWLQCTVNKPVTVTMKEETGSARNVTVHPGGYT